METRTVKFNIKSFIEEYIFLHESHDKEGEKKLLEKFNTNFYNSNFKVKAGIQAFIFNSKLAKEYPVLQGLSTRCVAFFTK